MPMSAPSVIIHVPHSSLYIPESARSQFDLVPADLDRELLLMTDIYTDELFELNVEDIQRLIYPVSRLVVDPERFRDDDDEPMSARGMGAVYMKTAHGEPLRRSLSSQEREQLLVTYYDPHHLILSRMVSESLDRHGRCLIIDAHSFPSKSLPCDLSQEPNRPDICIGTDPYHTPKEIVEMAENVFLSQGWSVGIDWPYRGALVPIEFFGEKKDVMSIMIEINRSMYMDEDNGKKVADFDAFRSQLQRGLALIIDGAIAHCVT